MAISLENKLSCLICTLESTSTGGNVIERDASGEASSRRCCATFPPLSTIVTVGNSVAKHHKGYAQQSVRPLLMGPAKLH